MPLIDNGVLISIQKSVRDTLLADGYFVTNDIPIFAEFQGDIDTAIGTAVDSLGLCLVVATPTANAIKRNLPKPYLSVRTMVMAFERVTLNDGPRGEDALEIAACILHNHVEPGIHDAISLQDEFFNPVVRNGRNGLATNYNVFAGIDRARLQHPAPGIADNGSGTITITSGVPGGGVFYTIDGREPNPTTSLLYTAPFAISSGVTVRTRTWLAGKLPSPESRYTR